MISIIQISMLIFVSLIQSGSTYQTSAVTYYDGVSVDLRPSFYRLNGNNGIQTQITESFSISNTDYFVRLWLRSQMTQGSLGQTTENILDIPSSNINCAFQKLNLLQCTNTVASLKIDTTNLQTKQWVHMSLSGQQSPSQSYLKVDYPDVQYDIVTSKYLSFTSATSIWNAFLGISSQLQNGLVGDIREFLFYGGFISSNQVKNIKNQVLLWDLQILAYYRFLNGNLNDEFRSESDNATLVSSNNKTQPYPSVQWDNMPNDLCYPFLNYTNVPFISISVYNPVVVPTAQLDERFIIKSTKYAYSASFWLKPQTGFLTTINPSVGKDTYYLFKLDQVFAIWFTDENHIQIYIYSTISSQDMYTQPIFFPLNQWANLQFILDQQKGYEVRVYNFQRQLMANISVSQQLPSQSPTRKFNLINNFQGYMKSLIVYQNNTGFPIQTPYDLNTDYSANTLLYYKLDYRQFNFKQLLFSLNVNPSYGLGPSLNFSVVPSFKLVLWEEYLQYTGNNDLGTINQKSSLFDGITCNDKNYTLYATQNKSLITYSLPPTTQDLFSFTLELWFYRANLTLTKNYLFSLYSPSPKPQEFMALYQDSDTILKCQPFPNLPSLSISIPSSSQSYQNWQHIACKFTSQFQVSAQHDNIDGQTFYYQSNTMQTLKIPKGQYQIIIGNNYQKMYGQTLTYLKEVRLWTTEMSTQQITQYLYQYVDPQQFPNTLFSYFQLAAGTPYISNFPGLNNNANNVTISGIYTQPQSTNKLCPLQTYDNQYGNGCYKDPYKQLKIHIFVEPTPNAPYLQYHITTQFSDMMNVYALTQVQFNWSISQLVSSNNNRRILQGSNGTNNSITNISSTTNQSNSNSNSNVQQNNSQLSGKLVSKIINANMSSQLQNQTMMMSLYIPQNLIRNQEWYQFQVSSTNQLQLFSRSQIANFTVIQCRWLGDIKTQQPINSIVLFNTPGSISVQLQFTVFYLLSYICQVPTNYSTLNPQLRYEVTPSQYASIVQNSISVNFIPDQQIYQVSIPSNAVSQFPMERPIDIVFTVSWWDSQYNQIDQYIAYRIMNAYPSVANITYTFANILINQPLFLDGSNSYSIMPKQNSSAGLSYYWICPSIFQSICAVQQNNRYLQISYTQFLQSQGQIGQIYQFQLAVRRANTLDQSSNATASINILWPNVALPNFDIEVNGGSVIASQDNQFFVDLSNYSPDDPLINYQWNITPNISIQPQFSQDQSQMTVFKNSFNFSTTYTITVTVWNSLYPSESQSIQTLQFTTLSPPTGGQVSISPLSGTYLTTVFTISISGYTSKNPPIQFYVWGIQQFNPQPFLLQQTAFNQGDLFQQTLPNLIAVIVQVTDASMESQFISQNIAITTDPNTDFNSLIQTISTIQDNSQRYDNYLYVSQQLANLDQFVNSTQSNLVLRFQIMNNTLNDLEQISTTNISQFIYTNTTYQTVNNKTNRTVTYTQTVSSPNPQFTQAVDLVIGSGILIDSLIQNSNVINDTLLLNAIQGLDLIKSQIYYYMAALNNDQFKQSYADALSDMLEYLQNKIYTKQSRRILQNSQYQDTMQKVVARASSYADNLCQQITQYETKTQTDTSSYSIIVEKFKLTSTVKARTYSVQSLGGQQLVVPVSDLLRFTNNSYQSLSSNSSKLANNITYICTQGFFYNFNTLAGYSFNNQSNQLQLFMELDAIDSNDYHFIDAKQVQNISSGGSFDTTFLYNFTGSKSLFSYNQTVCAYINSTIVPSNSFAMWFEDNCQTSYDYQTSTITCYCTAMGPYVYTIINDYNRIKDLTAALPNITNINVPQTESVDTSGNKQFQKATIAVLVIFIIFAVACPIIAIVLDKRDYKDLKEDLYDISEDLLRNFALQKNQPIEQVLYRQKMIDHLKNVEEPGFCTLFSIFNQYLHPIWGIFFYFDIEFKRFIRFILVLFHLSVLLIIITIIFGSKYRENDMNLPSRNTDGMDTKDKRIAVILGFFFSIFTLPHAGFLKELLRTKLVLNDQQQDQYNSAYQKVQKQGQQQKDKKGQGNDTVVHNDVSTSKIKNQEEMYEGGSSDQDDHLDRPHTQQRLQGPDEELNKAQKRQQKRPPNIVIGQQQQQSTQQKKSQNAIDEQVVAQDRCFICKVIMIIVAYALFIVSIIFMSIRSTKDVKANADCVVVCWYVMIIIGYSITNTIRIFFITCFGPCILSNLNNNQGQVQGCCIKFGICLFVPRDALEILKDLYIIQQIQRSGKYELHTQNNPQQQQPASKKQQPDISQSSRKMNENIQDKNKGKDKQDTINNNKGNEGNSSNRDKKQQQKKQKQIQEQQQQQPQQQNEEVNKEDDDNDDDFKRNRHKKAERFSNQDQELQMNSNPKKQNKRNQQQMEQNEDKKQGKSGILKINDLLDDQI